MIAQVIVDVVHTNVDRPFSYLIPEGMEVEQGSRVSVPLGKRRVDGFVVSLLEEDQLPADVPLQKLRPIAAVLDDYPAPVSYTHLDVYKRQVPAHGGPGAGVRHGHPDRRKGMEYPPPRGHGVPEPG